VEAGPLAVAVGHAARAHGVMLRPVVVASVVMVARNLEAGEEDGHGDEKDPGDDHNPRREPVQPVRFSDFSRCGGDRSRPGWVFWCFTHAEMMRAQRIGRARCNL
jgi:hypothetical protein